MGRTGYVARWSMERRRAGGTRGRAAAGRAAAGPAAATLTAVAVRTVVIVRCLVVGYTVVQVAIWHAYYLAGPPRLLGPAAVTLWAFAFLARLVRNGPGPGLAAADCVAGSVIAFCAALSVPPVMRGDTSNWLYMALAGESIVPLWFAPLALAAPLVTVLGAAYWVGTVLPASAVSGDSAPAAAVAVLATVAVITWSGYRILLSRAALADFALARADAEEHGQHVALSRNAERREHERLLHDTVLNTLTALSRPGHSAGGRREVIGRCRHDVALMEYVLGGAAARPAAARTYGGIVAAVEAVAAEARARGLLVHTQIAAALGQAGPAGTPELAPGDGMAEPPLAARVPAAAVSSPGAAGQRIPVPVVAAFARAAREALGNVALHARTGEAWVDVDMPESAAAGADVAAFTVTVRDSGTGFDPAGVGPARLGIRRSIVERVADCGGSATVVSAPGTGTTVTMRWPAAGPAQAVAARPAPLARAAPRPEAGSAPASGSASGSAPAPGSVPVSGVAPVPKAAPAAGPAPASETGVPLPSKARPW